MARLYGQPVPPARGLLSGGSFTDRVQRTYFSEGGQISPGEGLDTRARSSNAIALASRMPRT
jgi:hypothetical protein